MGNLGFQELLLILLFLTFPIGFSFLFYYLGKRSGYKKGLLEMYQKFDEERRSKQ